LLIKSGKKEIKKGSAFVYGLFQAVAVIPGFSRSGALITAGRLLGIEENKSTAFVFIASVPIILASTVLEVIKCITNGVVFETLPTVVGFLSAMCFGFVSTIIMKKMAKNARLFFGAYLCVLSLIISVV
jgi:undecaprenyl-diphosphatase